MPVKKFNFLEREGAARPVSIHKPARVRAAAKDRYQGLRGRAYLEARAKEAPMSRDDDVPTTPDWLVRP